MSSDSWHEQVPRLLMVKVAKAWHTHKYESIRLRKVYQVDPELKQCLIWNPFKFTLIGLSEPLFIGILCKLYFQIIYAWETWLYSWKMLRSLSYILTIWSSLEEIFHGGWKGTAFRRMSFSMIDCSCALSNGLRLVGESISFKFWVFFINDV